VSSDDGTHWKAQEGVLIGNHGDVVINGIARVFYFGGQYGRNANIDWRSSRPLSPAHPPARRRGRPGRGGRGGAPSTSSNSSH